WSASVNDPGEPLVNAADSETFGDRFFFGTATMASDGTVWVGFHCAKTGACPGRRVGVVGRLTERPGRPRWGRQAADAGPPGGPDAPPCAPRRERGGTHTDRGNG